MPGSTGDVAAAVAPAAAAVAPRLDLAAVGPGVLVEAVCHHLPWREWRRTWVSARAKEGEETPGNWTVERCGRDPLESKCWWPDGGWVPGLMSS